MIKNRAQAIEAIKSGNPRMHQWSEKLCRNEELVLLAAQANPFNPTYGADSLIPGSLLEKAARVNGSCIHGLIAGTPEKRELVTDELCREAIRSNGFAVGDVLSAITINRVDRKHGLSPIYPNLSEEFEVDDEMYRNAVASGYIRPKDIPEKYWTAESLRNAVRNNMLPVSMLKII